MRLICNLKRKRKRKRETRECFSPDGLYFLILDSFQIYFNDRISHHIVLYIDQLQKRVCKILREPFFVIDTCIPYITITRAM